MGSHRVGRDEQACTAQSVSKCEQSQKHGLHLWYLALILRPGVDGVSLTGPRGNFPSQVLPETWGAPPGAGVCFLPHRNQQASGTRVGNEALGQPCFWQLEAMSRKTRLQLLELFSAHWSWEPATMLGGSSDGPEATWSCSWPRIQLRSKPVSANPSWRGKGLQVP